MKKVLAILISAMLVLATLPIGAAVATSEENLLLNATHASGEVNWDEVGGNTWGASYEDQHNGPFGTSGGYSWEFHPDKGDHDYTADPVDIYITCNDLAANTYYEFSYIYSKKFAIDILSIADPDATKVGFALSPTASVSESDTTAKRVTAQFKTNDAGTYTVNLRINMQVYTSLSSYATILSDLSLIKLPDDTVLNLLSAATKANGQVTWDVTGGNTWGSNYEDQHNGPFGANGGYSWEFHPDNPSHDYTADPVDIYITCNNLEANAYYEFSYIYSGKFAIDLVSITDNADNAISVTTETAIEVDSTSDTPAKQVISRFTSNGAGDYSIQLRINMSVYNTLTSFTTMLSDLSLYQIDEIEYLGNSIRTFISAEHPQGLRYKFSLPEEILENGLGEYTQIAEIGCLAVKSEHLTDSALVLEGTYNGEAPKKNTISNMDDQLLTEDDYPGVKTFYVALINIGYNKADQTTDYTKYAESFSARAYVTFENAAGESKTVYSETVSANVFDVMRAINAGSNASDIAAVEDVFETFPACKEAYEAWLQ